MSLGRTLGCCTVLGTLVACSDGAEIDRSVGSVAAALEPDEVTIPPTGNNMNYYRCADDFGQCVIGHGKRYMAYGVNNSWLFKLVGGTVSCVPTTFGGDPAIGVPKSCYISNYGTDPSMPATGLALEGQKTTANGNVAFGANGQFFFKTIVGSFTCDTNTFGDPIQNVPKACYIAAPSYTRITNESSGDLTGIVNHPVAYGANGKFIYMVANGDAPNYALHCGVGAGGFPSDPAIGIPKDCYKLTDGHLNTPTVQLMAFENNQWTTKTNQSTNVFYGSGRNGNFVQTTVANSTGGCDNTNGDPDVGAGKSCWNAPVPGAAQGLWTRLTNDFPDTDSVGVEILQLMPDGSVMANSAGRFTRWYRLTAGSTGNFTNGTWTRLADSNLGRAFFPQAVLRDGRLFVGGGEYLFDQNGVELPEASVSHSQCEIYDPASNTWLKTLDFPFNTGLGDGLMAPLPNGKIMVAAGPFDSTSMEFDPLHPNDSLAWTSPENATVPAGVADSRFFCEGSLTTLRDGSVFLAQNGVDVYRQGNAAGMRWAAPIPAPPLNPYNNEGASALTLYTGKVLILGASSYNAVYDPVTNSVQNVARTPQVPPGILNVGSFGGADENGQAVMPTGHVLLAAHSSDYFFKFFDYDPATDTFADVSFGAPAALTEQKGGKNIAQTPLPDGSILVAQTTDRAVYVYRPPGAQLTSQGRPTITSITGPVNGVYTMTGTTLNGLTNGANRDDEGTNYTSFPVVSATSGSVRRYCVVQSVSSSSIAPNAPVTVKFSAPRAGWPGHGNLTILVSASGLGSSNSKTINVP